MAKLEIHPFSDEFRGEAAALLGARHHRQRSVEPLLPELDDPLRHVPRGRGAVATRDGEVVAYVVAEIDDERAVVGLAGCAASEPEAVRDAYAHAAREWPSRHVVYVPATDSVLIEPWFQLAFGCQFKTGVRETAVEPPVEFGGTIRSSTPDDLAAVAGLEQMLWQLQVESPSFSGVDVGGEDFETAWAGHWREDGYPLHAVAELDGRVVGHLVLYERPRGDLRIAEGNVDLSLAGTLPDVRGRGVGLALTAYALTFAHEQGFRSMTTDWRSVNLLSSRFWPRRGFRPTFLRLYRSVP